MCGGGKGQDLCCAASFSNQLRLCVGVEKDKIRVVQHPSLINSDCVWGWKRTRFVLCSSVESELVPHDFTFVSNYRHKSEIMVHST